ncbi:MAG: serine hydrolase domain-containing protein [Desulfobacterales bacterium]
MNHLDRLLSLAVKGRVFPGAVLRVSQRGQPRYSGAWGTADLTTGQPVVADTVFDLASLTKPLATALVFMRLSQRNEVDAGQRLADFWPEPFPSDKSDITFGQVLAHAGGFPAYRPYFERLCRVPPQQRKARLADWILSEPLEAAPGTRTIYSDLGFILVQLVLERATGKTLDRLFREEILEPLAISGLYFSNDREKMRERRVASTERCPWRGRVLHGDVHDENAFCLGGVGGHAGLFGSAPAVERLLLELLASWKCRRESRVFDHRTVVSFLSRPACGGRPLGFDFPGPGPSSSGRRFSANSVGHLGYTGTSFWMDPDREVVVILLTNRVHPSRRNERIREFRPLIHDAVMDWIGG